MTRTKIIIKPGSKWKTRDKITSIFTVQTVSRDTVRVKCCQGAIHRFSRHLFGKSYGYLPAVIVTPALVRQ